MEKHYTFIKNNRVINSFVFADKDDELAQRICDEKGYDSFVWLDEDVVPNEHSLYNGSTFELPTPQYLYSIGVLTQDPDAPVVPTE